MAKTASLIQVKYAKALAKSCTHMVKVWGSREDGNEDRLKGMLGAKQIPAT